MSDEQLNHLLHSYKYCLKDYWAMRCLTRTSECQKGGIYCHKWTWKYLTGNWNIFWHGETRRVQLLESSTSTIQSAKVRWGIETSPVIVSPANIEQGIESFTTTVKPANIIQYHSKIRNWWADVSIPLWGGTMWLH